MKKYSKIILSALLATTMTTSLVACNNKPATTSSTGDTQSTSTESKEGERVLEGNLYVTGLPILKEKETFKVMFPENTTDKSANGPADKISMIKAEEATNVKLEWSIVSGSFAEQVGLAFAGGEGAMPDLVFGSAIPASVTLKSPELMYNLTDEILEKYAPNIKKQYDEHNVWDSAKNADGTLYSLYTATYSDPQNIAQGVQLIRQDWLDRLNLKMPTTLDEFYNVMKAFKENDANGNGDPNDEVPMAFAQSNWCNRLISWAGSWGIAGATGYGMDNYLRIENGKVYNVLVEDRFKEFLRFYNKMSKEGLLNVEGFTMTGAQYNALLKEDVVGTYFAWKDDITKWSVVKPMAAEGYEAKKQGNPDIITGKKSFTITSACKNPNALLRWWDYLHSDIRLKEEMRNGPEGTLWEIRDDGNVWEVAPPEGKTSTEIAATEGFSNSNCPVIWPEEADHYDKTKDPAAGIRNDYADMLKDYFCKELMPVRNVNEEKASEKVLLENELVPYIDSFIATSVTKGLSDEEWEAHKEALKQLNIDQWVQWQQDFLDKKF